MKQLTKKVFSGGQAWSYESLWELDDGTKAKVEVCRNAYDCQSHARVSFYDPLHKVWNVVASTPSDHMKCLHLSYVDKNVKAAAFKDDEDTLLAEARLLLA